MNEWILEYKKKSITFFFEYGKLFISLFFLLISVIAISVIVSLVSPASLRVSFLDVGQGDAILVETPSGKTMLIDGGVSSLVLEKLSNELSYFDKDIDVMIATHPDADHITGLIPVLEKYKVGMIVTSVILGDTGIANEFNKSREMESADMRVAKQGDIIDFHDGVTVHILYPDNNNFFSKKDTNLSSVSVLVTYGNMQFLLTGDLPTEAEPKLITKSLPRNITVYKAGHHGSKYSSGEQLLSYIKPEYSIISAGKNNKYGHPNIEALERLQKYSKEIISTSLSGTIRFKTNGDTLNVVTDR